MRTIYRPFAENLIVTLYDFRPQDFGLFLSFGPHDDSRTPLMGLNCTDATVAVLRELADAIEAQADRRAFYLSNQDTDPAQKGE